MRAQALKNIARFKNGPLFNPPILGNVTGLLGALNIGNLGGGTNWPGGGYDPETHIVYAPASNAGVGAVSLVPPPPNFSDLKYVRGVAGQPFVEFFGPGDCCAADSGRKTRDDLPGAAPAATPPAAAEAAVPAGGGLTVQGLPLVKPPYGVLSAIHLDRGDLLWSVPHGDTPDNVRNHPALKGMNIPKTGQTGSVGLVVTKTLVVMGDPVFTTVPGRPRGAMLHAYNKATGEEVGAVWMPAPQSGSPMTYMIDGKQYIIVAVSGGSYSGEYIAYSLPN
jgi:quinoprotein glucose dehydrogenase